MPAKNNFFYTIFSAFLIKKIVFCLVTVKYLDYIKSSTSEFKGQLDPQDCSVPYLSAQPHMYLTEM